MLNDYHCHVLPQIDDGSKSVEMSLKMIQMIKEQGINCIAATPHFYAHRNKSVKQFLIRRKTAFEKIKKDSLLPILLGAEVAVEHGISKLTDIEKLRIADTKYILMELPYAPFSNWILEEIIDISYKYNLTPVLAHIHRYIDFYSKSEMAELLKTKAVLQFNNEAFCNFKERRFVKSLIKEGYPYVLGSDAHNLTSRKPNWGLLQSVIKKNVIDGTEILL